MRVSIPKDKYSGQTISHIINTDCPVELSDGCRVAGDVVSESVFSRLSHISGHVEAEIRIEMIASTAQSLNSPGDIECYNTKISREITGGVRVLARDSEADSITAGDCVDIKRCKIANTVASKRWIIADRCIELGQLSSEWDMRLLNCIVHQSVKAKNDVFLRNTRVHGSVHTGTILMINSTICGALTACTQRLVLKDSRIRWIELAYPTPEDQIAGALQQMQLQDAPARSHVVTLDGSKVGAIHFQGPGGIVELINGAFIAHITNGRILGPQPEDLFTKRAARKVFSQICSMPYEVADGISSQLDRKAGVGLALTSVEAAEAAGVRWIVTLPAKQRKLELYLGKEHKSAKNFPVASWEDPGNKGYFLLSSL